MSNDIEPWPFSEPTKDDVLSGVFGLVQILSVLVPPLGVAVATASVIKEGANTRRNRKIVTQMARALQQAQADAIEHGGRIEDLTAILEDEDSRLVPLIEATFTQMRQTADGHKMDRLRESLVTALLDPESEESETFVRLVVRYDDLAVYILRQLADQGTTPRELVRAPERIWETIEQNWPAVYLPGQIRATATALEADGLVASVPEGGMVEDPENPGLFLQVERPSIALTITPRGQRFMTFLREGDLRQERQEAP